MQFPPNKDEGDGYQCQSAQQVACPLIEKTTLPRVEGDGSSLLTPYRLNRLYCLVAFLTWFR